MLSFLLDGVEYRPYDHLYSVSSCGKFLRKLKPYEPKLRHDGYASLGRRLLAHRVVATVWCDKPEGADHVHHINHNKADNRAENLEWMLQSKHISEHHNKSSVGHKMSEEGKSRLRTLRLGSITSEETKQKQREASLRLGLKPPAKAKGYKHADSSKLKMSENSPNALPCVIFGVVYPSVKVASEKLGLKRLTLRKRILSPNFTEYHYLE